MGIEEIKKEIAAIVKKNLGQGDYRLFLFGSRARGDNWERSDIDIGIEAKEPISPAIKLQIEEDLNSLPTLYKFDLVDFKAVTDKFKEEALKNIDQLN